MKLYLLKFLGFLLIMQCIFCFPFYILMHQLDFLTGITLLNSITKVFGPASNNCFSNYDCAFSYYCADDGTCKRDPIGGIGPMRRICPDNNCQNFWRCDWIQGICKQNKDGRCSNSGDCPNKFLCATFSDAKLSNNSSSSTQRGFCIPGIILTKLLRNDVDRLVPTCSPTAALPQEDQKCSGLNGIYYLDD